MKDRYTMVELFAGIGGFSLAAGMTGRIRTIWANEINPVKCAVYRANFDERQLIEGDIREIPSHCVPDHDILTAGFPCQPFSATGKKKGLGDPRGTLFMEIVRILGDRRPRVFVLENVPGLEWNDGGLTLRTILNELWECGYHVIRRRMLASEFGLPHRRTRLIIVGFRDRSDRFRFKWPRRRNRDGDIHISAVMDADDTMAEYLTQEKSEMVRRHHNRESGYVFITKPHMTCPTLRGDGKSRCQFVIDMGEAGLRVISIRERLRLQGFPDDFVIQGSLSDQCQMTSDAIPVPMLAAVLQSVVDCLDGDKKAGGLTRWM